MAVILDAEIARKLTTRQLGVQTSRAAPLLESTAKPCITSPDMPRLRTQGRPINRGRGAVSNVSSRFQKEIPCHEEDGWDLAEDIPPLRTQVTQERAKTIITQNDSPDISFDRSINPYRGCEHGCVYCFARPTHAFLGLSPGLDFETKLFAKTNAARLLERELAAPNYVPKIIAIGTNTDPYQPIERKAQVMRELLEVLVRTNHPVGIVTKSALILRDLDLLAPMAEKGLVKVAISVTTLEPSLARKMEPRAVTPLRSMRFPRINRLRWDKPPAESDRLETLERMLAGNAARQSR